MLSIFLKEKRGQKHLNGGSFVLYWKKVFEDLTDEEKEKYKKKYDIKVENYNKKMEYYKKAIFDIPKKPKKSFALYLKDNINKIEQTIKNLKIGEIPYFTLQ